MERDGIIKTFEGRISYAHRAQNFHGKDWFGVCFFLHGHNLSYEIKVRGEGLDERNQMSIEFGKLKKVVNTYLTDVWDHSLIVCENDSILMKYAEMQLEQYESFCNSKALELAEEYKNSSQKEKDLLPFLKDLSFSELIDNFKTELQITYPHRVHIYPFNSTIENLTKEALRMLKAPCEAIGAKIIYLRCWEAPTSGYEIIVSD